MTNFFAGNLLLLECSRALGCLDAARDFYAPQYPECAELVDKTKQDLKKAMENFRVTLKPGV